MLVESFSGIRGMYGKDITAVVVRNYVLSYIDLLKRKDRKKQVVIGTDTRPSSKQIKQIMKKTFLDHGFDVIDVGYNTTPAIQLAVRHYKTGGGVIITGSHNEPEYNGWKFLSENGSVLVIEEIGEVIRNSKKKLTTATAKGKATDKEKELGELYTKFVLDMVGKIKANLNIVVDPNGGAAAVVIKQILEKAGIKAVYKNMTPGVFKRLVEPNKDSLAYLADDMEDAHLAAGWDCDADRVEIVMPTGKILSGQQILALLVDQTLSKNKGTVVVNDATSNVVHDVAKKHNAEVVEVEVGEINVVNKMYELNSPIGGEGSSSGGIFPPSRCRDGILTLMMLLKLIAEKGKSIGELVNDLPTYHTSRTNVKCPSEKAAAVRKNLEKYWKNKYEIRTTGDLTGGLKIITDDGWFWFRASKTEHGTYRIISDAKTKQNAEKLLAMAEESFNLSSNG